MRLNWTPEQLNEADRIARLPVRDRRQAIDALAEFRGCSYDAVADRIRQRERILGIEPHQGQGRGRVRQFTAEDWRLIRREFKVPTMTTPALAKLVGVNRRLLMERAKTAGVRRMVHRFQRDAIPAPLPPYVNGHSAAAVAAIYQGRRYEDMRTTYHLPVRLGPADRAVSLMGSAGAMCAP